MTNLRIIGDVHGAQGLYSEMTNVPYTIQVGDVGLNYAFINKYVNPDTNKIVMGNHDNYLKPPLHSAGDFGLIEVPNFGSIFFVRGAFSIDYKQRKVGVDFFEEEELSVQKLKEAIEFYNEIKPDFVVSHECPQSILPYICQPHVSLKLGYDNPYIKTKTSQALEEMRLLHKPKVHIFGHYHKTQKLLYEDTTYICLGELSFADFESKDKLILIHDRFGDMGYPAYKNREKLEVLNRCGCYFCKKTFKYDEIKEWTDEDKTAICPFCSVDAVVEWPDSLSLKMLYQEYFSIPKD